MSWRCHPEAFNGSMISFRSSLIHGNDAMRGIDIRFHVTKQFIDTLHSFFLNGPNAFSLRKKSCNAYGFFIIVDRNNSIPLVDGSLYAPPNYVGIVTCCRP